MCSNVFLIKYNLSIIPSLNDEPFQIQSIYISHFCTLRTKCVLQTIQCDQNGLKNIRKNTQKMSAMLDNINHIRCLNIESGTD